MASIGLTNLWFGELTEGQDGTPSYANAQKMGKAVSASVSITNNSAMLYGDDALAESDTSFASGTITLGLTDDDDTVFAPLLGHTLSEDGEVVKTSTDTAPYVGVGRVISKMVNGIRKYKVNFLYKVKFSEPNAENNTKGETVEFSTPEIEGIISALSDNKGTWGISKTFDDIDDAIAYLKGLLGITESV